MKHKDPTDPRAWLSRARGNLTLAEKGGRLKGILFEDLCFNAQQAAEKALKRFASRKAWTFRGPIRSCT